MLSLLLQLLLRPPPRLTMGCGPSNIINPRKWRSRARSHNSGSDAGSDEDADDAAPVPRRGVGVGTDADDENSALLAVAAAAASGAGGGAGSAGSGSAAAASGAESDDESSRAAAARLRQLAQNAPGPPLPHTYSPHIEVSASQTDFFRILDMKVESGPELDPDSESEQRREEARLRGLLREWERCRQERLLAQRDREQLDCREVPRAARHYQDAAVSRAGARAKPEHSVLSHGAALASSAASVRNAGGSPRHPQHPSQYPSNTTTTSHDWRRTNLAWVPEQRPVGVAPVGVGPVPVAAMAALGPAGSMGGLQSLYGQPYPGRAVSAWTHNSYQGYDTVGTWYTVSSTASPAASATSVGFRPYRQQSDAGQPGQWSEVGSGTARVDYDEGMMYHGQGLASAAGAEQGLGHDQYYSQQPYAYQGLGQRYGHGAGTGLGGGIGSGRHPDQHLANSMVQLDKSGSTRTELA